MGTKKRSGKEISDDSGDCSRKSGDADLGMSDKEQGFHCFVTSLLGVVQTVSLWLS